MRREASWRGVEGNGTREDSPPGRMTGGVEETRSTSGSSRGRGHSHQRQVAKAASKQFEKRGPYRFSYPAPARISLLLLILW